MRKLRGLSIACALFFGGTAYGSCNSFGCISTGDEVLSSVYPTLGRVYLEPPSAADKAALNCTLVSGHYMTLEKSYDNFDAVYSTILTALSTGTRFQVRIAEGSTNCRVVYVRMCI